MPRLYHRKSPNGCQRCKQRRVKCDEKKPKCGACTRHGVPCVYPAPATGSGINPRKPSQDTDDEEFRLSAAKQRIDEQWGTPTSPVALVENDFPTTRTTLEMRLLHFFLLYTCNSFSTADDYWRVRVPMLAYDHRPVFDGLLSVAAMHLRRHSQDGEVGRLHRASEPWINSEAFLAGSTSEEMRHVSVHYLNDAIRGHRKAFQESETENFQPVFVSSVLILYNSLFHLSEYDEEDESGVAFDECLWLRLGIGPRELAGVWRAGTGRHMLVETGVVEGGPDFEDSDSLFNPENRKPFDYLLLWAAEFEYISEEDRLAFEKTLSYIGQVHDKLLQASEPPLATSRRFIAFASRAPPHFSDMALLQKPRALAMLAHLFALMSLISTQVPWFAGIAEKQIPSIHERLPRGWKAIMQWPLAIVARGADSAEPIPVPPTIEELNLES